MSFPRSAARARSFVLCLAGIVAASIVQASSTSPGSTDDNSDLTPIRHAIAVDRNGRPVDPHSEHGLFNLYRTYPRQQDFINHIDSLFAGLDAHLKAARRAGRTPRILFFIHGGLATYAGSFERVRQQYRDILDEKWTGDGGNEIAGSYPIFIVWSSRLEASLFEQLSSVVNGRERKVWGKIVVPIAIPTQLAASIVKTPIDVVNQVYEDAMTSDTKDTQPIVDPVDTKNTRAIVRYLEERRRVAPSLSIEVSSAMDDNSRWYVGASRFMLYLRTFPAKVATSFVISGLGERAWTNMKRRSRAVFRPPDEFNLGHGRSHSQITTLFETQKTGTGALSVFFDQLSDTLSLARNQDVEVTIVAHSMGSFVANEILSRWSGGGVVDEVAARRRYDTGELPVKNIVYMAAACSVEDMRRAVIPYLETHPKTQFYNLSLHHEAERRERNAGDLPFRGSLLNWIDNFYENPAMHVDRTLGKWENIIQAAHTIPPPVRSQVHLKSFALGVNPDSAYTGTSAGTPGPQIHGDFSRFKYWDSRFWMARSEERQSLLRSTVALDAGVTWQEWFHGLHDTYSVGAGARIENLHMVARYQFVQGDDFEVIDPLVWTLGLGLDYIQGGYGTHSYIGYGNHGRKRDRSDEFLVLEVAQSKSVWFFDVVVGYHFALGADVTSNDNLSGWLFGLGAHRPRKDTFWKGDR